MVSKVGVCFSKEFTGRDPLGHIGKKLPVYLRFLTLCQKEGWETYILTRRNYQGDGLFAGAWLFVRGEFKLISKKVRIDLLYDRTGGVKFPPKEETKMKVVDSRDFKLLCWDKWLAFKLVGKYMPQTFWVGEKENLASVLPKVKTDWVVLKPHNGLRGLGIFIGPKKGALSFEFPEKFKNYIAQEFIDTSGGIPKITTGLHDLRVVIVNGKPVWNHVIVPPSGSFSAHTVEGGILKEVDDELVPDLMKKIVLEITPKFYQKYDNPVFSLDFGFDKNGQAWLFEINDQIGFPRWGMKKRDLFLKELVKNFAQKLEGVK
ncbi:hypothetical protein MUP50_00460 [Patescibacteria group bacterium]|nr:hypothetical protein [Patescibacteria group bacterium]